LNVLLIGAAPIAAPRVSKRLIDWRNTAGTVPRA
jgi:hypothetical protein